MNAQPAVLEVRNLCRAFRSTKWFAPASETRAASDVSFRLERGQAVALVGESGSGKSTIGRLLLRLDTPDRGSICLAGEDVLQREPRRASLAYRRQVQMVFQDPFGSLNPVHRIGYHLERPLRRHGAAASAPAAVRARVLELLDQVGLVPAEDFIDRYPYELSGGQRQRVAIARALAVEPTVLVADEPTSMLDVSIRMGVLNLLAALKRDRGLAILLITHDLASARYLAERILVLYRGRLVEDGPSESIVRSPAHPYTQALLGASARSSGVAAPGVGGVADDDGSEAFGEPVAAAAPAAATPTPPVAASRSTPGTDAACPFAPRCPQCHEPCLRSEPAPRAWRDRTVRCHLYPADPGAAKD